MKRPHLSLNRLTSIAAVSVLALSAAKSDAAVLVSFNPTGTSVNGPLAPASTDSSVTSTDFTRGSGTAGYDNAGGATDFFGAYYTQGNPSAAADAELSDAYSNGIYLTFTITAGSSPVTITGLSLSNDFFFQNAVTYSVEDAISGFGSASSNVLASISYANGAEHQAGPGVLTFSTPQTLAANTSDEFRLYVNGLSTYTDFGIGDGGTTPANANAFEVLGSAATPEPGSYALVGLGLGLLVLTVAKRRALSS